MTNKKHRVYAMLLILFTVIVCMVETFTKGWMILSLVPISLVVLPTYAIVTYLALRQDSGPYARALGLTGYVLTLFILVAYICTVGIINTQESVLFGFLSTTNNDLITYSALASGWTSYFLAPITFTLLIGLLIARRTRKSLT